MAGHTNILLRCMISTATKIVEIELQHDATDLVFQLPAQVYDVMISISLAPRRMSMTVFLAEDSSMIVRNLERLRKSSLGLKSRKLMKEPKYVMVI